MLCIAGNDSAGLAGLQADMRTLFAFDIHTASVVSANTAQNNQQVISINPVNNLAFKQQLIALAPFAIDVMKVGLLATAEQVATVIEHQLSTQLQLVWDPVLLSSSQKIFSDPILLQAQRQLIRHCDILTPNRYEAGQLLNTTISSKTDVETAAETLLKQGAKAVLITGGVSDGKHCQDYFADATERFWLSSPGCPTNNTRGTGCALSTAIAATLALGYSIYDAVTIAKAAINQGLRQSYGLRAKCNHPTQTSITKQAPFTAHSLMIEKGTLNISHFPDTQHDMPTLIQPDNQQQALVFAKPCLPNGEALPLGLYPVVANSHWLEKLLLLGISTIQLRIKNLQGHALEQEVAKSIVIAKQYNSRLFINDHWQLAIKLNAYGVHLGQEDLASANIAAIHAAGLRLGISTHCHYEVARALSMQPSYIACGPIYHTTTKIMPWQPLGIKTLNYWQKTLDYPLVAIGGINSENIIAVAETGVDGIAMISAIINADDPNQQTLAFLAAIKAARRQE